MHIIGTRGKPSDIERSDKYVRTEKAEGKSEGKSKPEGKQKRKEKQRK